MVDAREIQEIEKHGTFYGESFTVVIGLPPNGQPFIKAIRFEGRPDIKPDHDPVDTVDAAVDVGFRIACGEIGADY